MEEITEEVEALAVEESTEEPIEEEVVDETPESTQVVKESDDKETQETS